MLLYGYCVKACPNDVRRIFFSLRELPGSFFVWQPCQKSQLYAYVHSNALRFMLTPQNSLLACIGTPVKNCDKRVEKIMQVSWNVLFIIVFKHICYRRVLRTSFSQRYRDHALFFFLVCSVGKVLLGQKTLFYKRYKQLKSRPLSPTNPGNSCSARGNQS